MVQADHKGVFAFCEIVRRREVPLEQNIVQNIQGADITRSETDKNNWICFVVYLLIPLLILEDKARKLFPERKKKVFR